MTKPRLEPRTNTGMVLSKHAERRSARFGSPTVRTRLATDEASRQHVHNNIADLRTLAALHAEVIDAALRIHGEVSAGGDAPGLLHGHEHGV